MPDLYPLLWPLIRCCDAERAHALAVRAARLAPPLPARAVAADPRLHVRLWGRDFANPVGLAAGFDKNAEVCDAMLRLGFGFVEAGTLTLRPQPGNPRPRLFRLEEDRAVINRMGFNNRGAADARVRLAARRRGVGVVGVNVGPNKDAEDPAADCARAAALLAPFADYLVVNVSSPNTPGLRALQARAPLEALLSRVRESVDAAQPPGEARIPLLVKLAPDLTEAELADVAHVVLELAIDGVIATNTTLSRPDGLHSRYRGEAGGLSGGPLRDRATAVLATLYRLTAGRVPLIGVGGIASGADAYARIRAGASLVQLYTALVYAGPGLVGRICRELGALLHRDGFASVAEAVGADAVAAAAADARAGTAP